MPKCKNCDKQFPCRVKDENGKEIYLHKRSYCLNCSPLGSGNGYKIRKQQNREQIKDKKGRKECPVCGKLSKWNKNNVCSTCRSKYLRYKRKINAVEYAGGKCIKCECNDPDILTFHHRDRETKVFNLSWNWTSKNWEVIKEEIDKCDLLCQNCHTKLHALERKDYLNIVREYFEPEDKSLWNNKAT